MLPLSSDDEYAPAPELLQKNYRHLVQDIAWFGLAIPATARFLSVYAIRLDTSAFLLGLMTSLPAMVSLLSSMFAGRWRDRYATTVEAQFWPGFGFRAIFLLPALTPFLPGSWQPYWLVVAVTLPSVAQGISSVTFLVLMREGVGMKALASLTSRRSLAFHLAFGVSTLAFGAWLQAAPFPINYQIMYVLAFFLSMGSLWHVKQVQSTSHETRRDPARRRIRPWSVPAFRRVTMVLVVTHISFFLLAAIIPLRLVEELNADEEFMSYFGVAELAAAATMAALSFRIMRRIGTINTIALSMTGTALAALILFGTSSLPVTLVASALSGGSWVLVSIAAFNYFSQHTPPEKLTAYSTLFNQIVSLSIFVGPIIGSQLASADLSLTTVLLIGAILRLISAGVTLVDPFQRSTKTA